jgi:hypothetical protein
MLGWIVGGVVVVAVVGVIAKRSALYRRLFSDEHFAEVARAAASLKAGALERVLVSDLDGPRSPADPRVFVSSAGLAIVYTVRQLDGGFVHHCSVSLAGSPTAHALGATFLLFVTRFIGLDWDGMGFEVGRSTVHHGEIMLTPPQHDTFAKQAVAEPSRENVSACRVAADAKRAGVAWRRVQIAASP